MNLNQSIPEELVPQVLEKASRLYQQQSAESSYSLAELMAAGSEVKLPPELVQQAYRELQAEQEAVALRKVQRQKQVKIGGAIAAAVALLSCFWIGSTYNRLNTAETLTASKWAQVENQMQRRADLIPQLTQVAQSSVYREAQLVESLSAAREAFLSAETVVEQSVADEKMKEAIAQFQTFAANNQQLQSNQLFINLQYEIAGTENRIATERMRYNEAVADYNQSVKGFPTVAVSSLLGFEPQIFLGDERSQG